MSRILVLDGNSWQFLVWIFWDSPVFPSFAFVVARCSFHAMTQRKLLMGGAGGLSGVEEGWSGTTGLLQQLLGLSHIYGVF